VRDNASKCPRSNSWASPSKTVVYSLSQHCATGPGLDRSRNCKFGVNFTNTRLSWQISITVIFKRRNASDNSAPCPRCRTFVATAPLKFSEHTPVRSISTLEISDPVPPKSENQGRRPIFHGPCQAPCIDEGKERDARK
jgi:hypothetical protein